MFSREKLTERRKMDVRVAVCAIVMILPLAGLAVRLWQLQILQSAEHIRKVSRQSIRTVRVNPVRGRIYSSDGALLVGNKCVYDIVFHPVELRRSKLEKDARERQERKKREAATGTRENTEGSKSKEETLSEYILKQAISVSELIGKELVLTEKKIRQHINQQPAMPMTVFRNLDEAELCRIWELAPWIPGMDVEPRYVRDYKMPGTLSHVIGFTATLNPEKEFSGTDFDRSYVRQDQAGRSGLELMYDRELSGTPGAEIVRVDPIGYARGQLLDALPVVNGNDILLTVDSRMQRIGEALMSDHHGALVVLDVNTGGVLAMVSAPGFSLENLTAATYKALNADNENKPMLNRAVNAMYTPGSIVKPLVGMAALECGAIDTEWRHNCIGYLKIGNRRIHCAKRSGHGELDIYDAITVSCNPFFMEVGIKTTLDNLNPLFKAAGFGQKTGIDIEEYVRGLCPSRQAAKDRLKRNWLVGDTADCSMGQGLIQVTPLQIAVYCAALANGGEMLRPFLVQEIRRGDGTIVRRTPSEVRRYLPVSERTKKVIRSAMCNAVESEQGSGKLLNRLVRKDKATGTETRVYLAAKTGTAEIGIGENKKKDTWMIVYGPLPKPEIAFACVVENGESGSKTVAPIAFEFWKQWIDLEETP